MSPELHPLHCPECGDFELQPPAVEMTAEEAQRHTVGAAIEMATHLRDSHPDKPLAQKYSIIWEKEAIRAGERWAQTGKPAGARGAGRTQGLELTVMTPNPPNIPPPDIQIGWEWMTPEVAKELLARNEKNRPMIFNRVAAYEREMKRPGRWKNTAEPIQVARSGALLNGQNRLQALVNAGVSLWMVVARGLEEDSIDAMDQGAKRTAGQVLAIHGEKHAFALAAACGMRYRWDAGSFPGNFQPTVQEIEEILYKYPQMREAAGFSSLHRVAGLAITPQTFLHHLFAEINVEDAEDFFTALSTGISLKEDSPIYVLREALISNHSAKRKAHPDELMAWTVKCWNAYRERRVIRNLRWRTEGPHAEAFPRPV